MVFMSDVVSFQQQRLLKARVVGEEALRWCACAERLMVRWRRKDSASIGERVESTMRSLRIEFDTLVRKKLVTFNNNPTFRWGVKDLLSSAHRIRSTVKDVHVLAGRNGIYHDTDDPDGCVLTSDVPNPAA